MAVIPLLSPETPTLKRLTLKSIRLDSTSPSEQIRFHGEAALYMLVGKARVYWKGLFLGTMGGRSSVSEPLCHVIRFPKWPENSIAVMLDGFSAEALWITCASDGSDDSTWPLLPYFHYNDTTFHQVGTGTHQRRVAEVQTPIGFEIALGETLNIPGGTSSWPAHASDDDMQKFCDGKTSWEECMYFVCPKPGVCHFNGYFNGSNWRHNRRIAIDNDTAHVMPLGSHAITAAPDSTCWYFWSYVGDALTKTYNRWASNVGTYQK